MAENDHKVRAAKEAAAWLARLKAPSVEQAELDAFFEWHRDPINQSAYESIERLWAASSKLGGDRDIAQSVHDALARPRWQQHLISGQGQLRRHPGMFTAIALSLFGAIIAGVGLSIQGVAYKTGIGEQRLVALSDGSTIELDTDTSLRVRFTSRQRTIYLDHGQALFQVSHQADRPLSVRVGSADIQDLGTRFDVRTNGEQTASISVIEGNLRLVGGEQSAPDVEINAGQGSRFDTDGWSAALPIDVALATSWTAGLIAFQDTPLSSAIAEINRYNKIQIRLTDPAISGNRISGTFKTRDIAGFVSAVEAIYRLRAENDPDGTIRLKQ